VDKAMLSVSPELIAQLFDKLISNAISFHKKGTPITLIMSHRQNSLVLELKNYGELIDHDKLSAIFSSLTSYRRQKSHSTHLGIGLHIAQLISQYHGGTLEASNNMQDQSVSFTLILPYSYQGL
jgi:K+-sensing histidine kinase KdpD